MKKFALISVLFGVFNTLLPLSGQDGFGFGFSETESDPSSDSASSAGANPSVKISGEAAAQLLGYIDDFSSGSKIKETSLGDVFRGKLNFAASAFNADAVINLKLAPVFDGSASPVVINEAYLQAYFGSLSITGGLRKLTWGKADSLGPLDVVNPLDYRDLTDMTNLMDRKLARPMIHASYRIGSFTKLEGVFIPWFEGHRFADAGRWAPSQIAAYPILIENAVSAGLQAVPNISPGTLHPDLTNPDKIAAIQQHYGSLNLASLYPATAKLEYAQAGLRFTSTIGSSDFGVQYFFGNFFRPAVTINGIDTFFQNPYGITPNILYNRYHQIGVDYAQVIAGFNLRAELAAHITSDLSGGDGSVYNPSIAWSLGFDRDIIWGINLNIQAVESVRLLYDKIGTDIAYDAEADAKATATRLTGIISKKFLRDELELKVTGLWGVEDGDFFILPALIWTKGDLSIEGSAGFLGGKTQGELGQYHKNSFIKFRIGYRF
ncbi:MAG: hypothetical protein LBD29_02635 [Treponema sp.]|jgi:hypothetical protein|nr:hypothetical protein [Treponema sp.]